MNDIAKLRAAAVARRKADGIAVNKFLGESVKADPSDYCLDEFKWFCHERENLRLTGDTQDFILKHNKFTNILEMMTRPVSGYLIRCLAILWMVLIRDLRHSDSSSCSD